MEEHFKQIKKLYVELKAERSKYTPRWEKIAKYAGIKSPLRNNSSLERSSTESTELDKYTYDPTAALSIQQSSDYLKGIMWGDGVGVFNLEPTDNVLDNVDISAVSKWYEFATNKLLQQMNDPEAGLDSALSSYFYDQKAFGTSGVGCFVSNEFKNGISETAFQFRSYGVDRMCIDEGKGSSIDTVFTTYDWRVNRIVSEFCSDNNGGLLKDMFSKLPERIKKAYESKNVNETFKIVHGVVPNPDYQGKTKIGKNGCKYIGYWFCEEESSTEPFYTEYYEEKPICVGREERINGELYGRSSGCMLLSSIECLNESVAGVMETMDKMQRPPIGIFSGSLWGDSKVDTSANGLTVFNFEQLNGQNPMIKMQDVGDPTPLVNFLLPYLNEKIATAFKIDILLDFASKSNMTATESLQRYAIRGHSLTSLIVRHKNEMFVPLINRCISILLGSGELGIDPTNIEAVKLAQSLGKEERIIPQEVIDCIRQGKRWFNIRFNNEIEKLTRTSMFEDLNKEITVITALMQMNPQLAQAVDWHRILREASDSLGFGNIVLSEQEFKEMVEAQYQQNAMIQQAQIDNVQSQTARNNAGALESYGKAEEQGNI